MKASSVILFLVLVSVSFLVPTSLYADNCAGSGSIIPDDSNPDGFYQVPEAYRPVDKNAIAQNFKMPDRTTRIKKVCVCLSREVTGPSDGLVKISHLTELNRSYTNPPVTLQTVETSVYNIPVKPAWSYYSVDVDFQVEEFMIYGIAVDLPLNVLLCGDKSEGPLPYQYFYGYNKKLDKDPNCEHLPVNFCTPVPEGFNLQIGLWKKDVPRQMGIRLQVESETPGAGCIPTDETLCLIKGRFSATMKWGTTPQTYKPAKTAVLSFADNSGIFYFNSPDNAEVLLKVLNACVPELGNRIWVFFAATTNVGFEIEIHDTLTGEVRRYDNDVNTPASPVQDTSAFTCE